VKKYRITRSVFCDLVAKLQKARSYFMTIRDNPRCAKSVSAVAITELTVEL